MGAAEEEFAAESEMGGRGGEATEAEGKIAECDLSSVLKILRSEAKDSYERTTITHHYEM